MRARVRCAVVPLEKGDMPASNASSAFRAGDEKEDGIVITDLYAQPPSHQYQKRCATE